jgi:hypothetical protein
MLKCSSGERWLKGEDGCGNQILRRLRTGIRGGRRREGEVLDKAGTESAGQATTTSYPLASVG